MATIITCWSAEQRKHFLVVEREQNEVHITVVTADDRAAARFGGHDLVELVLDTSAQEELARALK